jgi:hypothetical protein
MFSYTNTIDRQNNGIMEQWKNPNSQSYVTATHAGGSYVVGGGNACESVTSKELVGFVPALKFTVKYTQLPGPWFVLLYASLA